MKAAICGRGRASVCRDGQAGGDLQGRIGTAECSGKMNFSNKVKVGWRPAGRSVGCCQVVDVDDCRGRRWDRRLSGIADGLKKQNGWLPIQCSLGELKGRQGIFSGMRRVTEMVP